MPLPTRPRRPLTSCLRAAPTCRQAYQAMGWPGSCGIGQQHQRIDLPCVLPAIGLRLRAGCCRRHSADDGWAAAGDPFSFRGSCRLWARSQLDKASRWESCGPRTKKPHAANRAGLESWREIAEAPIPSSAEGIRKTACVNYFHITPALSSFPMSIDLASPRMRARSKGSCGRRGDSHTLRPE